jgi:uracil-DNA glycosylase
MEYWLNDSPDLRAAYNNIVEYLDRQINYTPERHNVFRMFEMIKPEAVRVVIIGQDPYKAYNGVHYADGIAFSLKSNDNEFIGGSQINMSASLGKPLRHYQFDYLIHQGVLMLNSALTTPMTKGTHDYWKPFTVGILRKLLNMSVGKYIIIRSWGGKAREIANIAGVIDYPSADYKTTCHPSPRNMGEDSNIPLDKQFIKCNHLQEISLATNILF